MRGRKLTSEPENEKIFCTWCQQWKHGHKVKTINHTYKDNLGSEEWKTHKIMIHKHHKGSRMCKGSDKIVQKKEYS